MNEQVKGGFEYLVEVVDRNGNVVDSEVVKNLMPTEGINHVLGVVLKGVAPVSSWFVGIYEGSYTPASTDTMATFPGAATECTAYDEATREAFVSGAITSGSLDNGASKAEFTMNAAKTIHGGFIGSSSSKGSTSGVLLSVVRFASPKVLDVGSILRVTAGFTMASA
jgi:hypothetical protein